MLFKVDQGGFFLIKEMSYVIYKSLVINTVLNILLLPLSILLLIFKRKKSFILMYHLVCQELNYDSLNKGIVISKTTFLRQIKLLRWLGFLFIGPSDIRIKNGVLMTFDDGYAETYREIKDIVKYVHDAGNGTGPIEEVGHQQNYKVGVLMGIMTVEAITSPVFPR